MFREVERPRSPTRRPGSPLSGYYVNSDDDDGEDKPYNIPPTYSNEELDILTLYQFCYKDATGLTIVRLCGNELSQPRRELFDDTEAGKMAEKLFYAPNIGGIDFSYNRIGDIGAEKIAKCFQRGWKLEMLNLMNNELGPTGAMHLSKALINNWVLHTLRLNGNALGPEGGRHIADLLLAPSCGLRELDMGETHQDSSSLTALLTGLHANETVRRVVLDRPILREGDDDAALQLGRMLRANTALQFVSVRKWSLTDDQLRAVCEGLAANRSLTELDLSANSLHQDAVKHLVAAMAENQVLKILRLCHNCIKTEGATWLANGLAQYGPRDEIHIRANGVKSDGLLALLNELKYNNIQRLHFWDNPWCARVPAEVDVLWKTGVIDGERVDVRPYVVDYTPYLAELRQLDRQRYYNVTKYGDRSNKKVRIGYPV